MMTINEMLQTYNSIAPTPLKVWKASKEKLEERINAIDPNAIRTVHTDRVPAEVIAEKVFAKIEEKVVHTPDKPKPIAKAVKPEGDNVPAFCKSNGVNPKVARAALRKAGFKAPYILNEKTRGIIHRSEMITPTLHLSNDLQRT